MEQWHLCGLDELKQLEADIEKLQLGAAGKSSVTKELEVRSESKKIVPHEHGFATNLLFPENEGLQTVKRAEVLGNVQHEAWQQGEMAAGNGSVHNAHLKHREIEYVDGQKGSRKARGSPKESPGAAGKKIGKESSLMRSKKNPHAAGADMFPESRPFGKASGLRAHSDSDGVASVLGSPSKKAASAYEMALAEGRALLFDCSRLSAGQCLLLAHVATHGYNCMIGARLWTRLQMTGSSPERRQHGRRGNPRTRP